MTGLVRGWGGFAAVVLLGVVLMLGLPQLLDLFGVVQMTVFAAMAMYALSQGFLWGYGGIMSFGQAAFLGLGGYAYAVAAINFGDSTFAVVLAVLAPVLFAALLGYFMFYGRISDAYIGVITLTVSVILFELVNSTSGSEYRIGSAELGGFNGMPGVPALNLPFDPADALDPVQTWYACIGSLIAVYILLRAVLASRFGRVVVAIRENETRAMLLGYDPAALQAVHLHDRRGRRWPGGRAVHRLGRVHQPHRVRPHHVGAGDYFRAGGRARDFGWPYAGRGGDPVPHHPRRVTKHGGLESGAGRGAGRLRGAGAAGRGAGDAGPAAAAAAAGAQAGGGGQGRPDQLSPPLLEARGVTMRFGGVTAVSSVDLTLQDAELRCLIGPNGAGKSTFFKVLTGQLQPSEGTIRLRGRDVTGANPHEIARLGVGIKTQVPNVFNGLSVRENVFVGAARLHGAKQARAIVDKTLARLQLDGIAERLVGQLAHGQRQWVEMATVLAQEPQLILLDEPAAGMNHAEVLRTADLIREINRTQALVVVEHDMQFIRMIASTVTVFNQGAILMQDEVGRVLADQRVRDVYLGKQAA